MTTEMKKFRIELNVETDGQIVERSTIIEHWSIEEARAEFFEKAPNSVGFISITEITESL